MANGMREHMTSGEEIQVEREGQEGQEAQEPQFARRMVPIFVGPDPGITDVRILELKYLLRPDEVANILRISVSTVYELCASETLRHIKVRKSIRIKTDSVRYLLGLGRRP